MARQISKNSNLFKRMLQSKNAQYSTLPSEPQVLFTTVNNIGIITFNRPKVLNIINLAMLEEITRTLKQWETERSFIILKAAGEKAFSAGGDLKAVIERQNKTSGKYGFDFFRAAYTSMAIVAAYKIPSISVMDGIIIGGAFGISVNCPYRIATERTTFSMPEVAVGSIADSGASQFLPRLGGKLDRYLALTGARVIGSDMLKVGFATHFVESKDLKELEASLLECNESNIQKTLNKYSVNVKEFSLQPILDKINKCFSGDTIEIIMSNLQKDESKWAQDTLNTLEKMCPTSLKITLKQFELGRNMSFQESLEMEYRIVSHCMKNKNFYEGIRALLIDKDRNPKWTPSTLSEVSDEFVESHFSKLPDVEELNLKLKLKV